MWVARKTIYLLTFDIQSSLMSEMTGEINSTKDLLHIFRHIHIDGAVCCSRLFPRSLRTFIGEISKIS